jgi:maltooligosyltrehalose synthase
VHGASVSITVVPRLIAAFDTGNPAPLGEIWKDTRVDLPPQFAGSYFNIFTGEAPRGDEACGLRIADLFPNFPVAILTRMK